MQHVASSSTQVCTSQTPLVMPFRVCYSLKSKICPKGKQYPTLTSFFVPGVQKPSYAANQRR